MLISLQCKSCMSQGSKKPIYIMGSPRVSSLERHCSSGPFKLNIFDIYWSTLTQSNCLGLSSSIFDFRSIFSVVKKLFFGCICGQLNNEQGETVKILFYSENSYKIHWNTYLSISLLYMHRRSLDFNESHFFCH